MPAILYCYSNMGRHYIHEYLTYGRHELFLNSQSWIQSKRASLTQLTRTMTYFTKFKSWCRQFNLEYLPAKASTVTIYLTSLIQSGCSVSVLNSNFYAVKWYHDMHLFNDVVVIRVITINTRSRKLLLEAVSAIGLDKTLLGLHSLRSGGASQAANNNVTDRLFKAHGRWRSENAKDGYVKDSLLSKLSVTKLLSI